MVRGFSALRRLPFFVGKFLRDLSRPVRYPSDTRDVHGPRLGHYYLVFDEGELRSSIDLRFDAHGIPAILTYVDVEPRQLHYYPITIGQYALAVFHTWLRSSRQEDEQRFLNLANWFVEHQAQDGCWYAQIDMPTYQLPAPWPSAMGQGRAISVLARAWQCTADEEYLECALRSLAAFTLPIERGGVMGEFDGQTTYEEYPAKPAPHVLNGMIFALFGVWDLARVLPDNASVRAVFERGVATLEGLLHLYDVGWWSLYDLFHLETSTSANPCTAHYHDIHVRQLEIMYAITGRPTFETFARRWDAYHEAPHRRLRASLYKAAFVTRRKLV